jgi:iron complex transport system ATP-binding protein
VILSVRNLCQGYSKRKDTLKDISFEAETGKVVSLIGPNGCGKTTLIKTICGIYDQRSGTVSVDNTPLCSMGRKETARTVGYVPQNVTYSGYSTVFDTVLLGRFPYVEWTYTKKDIRIASEALKCMGLEDLSGRDINHLSGGQRQKVFIARSLAQDPRFYIFDEPTNSLDLKNQLNMMKIMKDIVKEKKACLVVALHDLNLAMRYSNEVIILKDGFVFDNGPPEDVITVDTIEKVYGVRSKIFEENEGFFIHLYESID